MRLLNFLKFTEAPVRDFTVDPSVNQYYHGTWSRRDQAMLGNPKMADIVTKRIKTGIPIDMHFAGLIQIYLAGFYIFYNSVKFTIK